MKKNKGLPALLLALALTVGLAGGAMAYSTPDFADVAPGNWAYEPVMRMADAGVIKGTSGTTFSPDMKLSAAMFLTLVGRVSYPDDVTTEGAANWYAPWVEAAKAKGLLEGTAVTDAAIESEITRYDMAVILAHTAKSLGAKEQTVDTSKIKDYGDIPTKYAAAVGQTYALGLIKGDNAGNFNGGLTMTRAEAATVTARLVDLVADLASKPTEPEKPVETTPPQEDIPPRTGETVTVTIEGTVYESRHNEPLVGANIALFYKDGRELGRTVSGEDGKYILVVEMDKADYTLGQKLYYIEATGIDSAGNKYSNIYLDGFHNLKELYEMTKWSYSLPLWNTSDMDLDF